MADIYRDAYPSLRLYLYDLRDVYASPFTVFGPKRAVLFLGQAYLVLNGADHIRMFARRFDDIIRPRRRAAPRGRARGPGPGRDGGGGRPGRSGPERVRAHARPPVTSRRPP